MARSAFLAVVLGVVFFLTVSLPVGRSEVRGDGGSGSGAGGRAHTERTGCMPGRMETTSAVVAAATDSAVAAATSHPPCTPGDTSKCLYRPAQTYDVMPSFLEDVTYQDVLGETRTVPIAVYRPKNAPRPAPVVVLSHGGADGKTNPTKSMDKWAAVVASAGYTAVAIAHAGRNSQGYTALCDHLKVPETIQCAIKINWDRPHDVGAVLDWLARKSTEEPWQGVLDLSRIAHVGHSAGASAGQMLGGVPVPLRRQHPSQAVARVHGKQEMPNHT